MTWLKYSMISALIDLGVFYGCKNEKFIQEVCDVFLYIAQNIVSVQYTQFMFLADKIDNVYP